MLFKGLGSFKKMFKIGGNVDELKAYRLIPLTPHLLFHFTLPLSKRLNNPKRHRMNKPEKRKIKNLKKDRDRKSQAKYRIKQIKLSKDKTIRQQNKIRRAK